MNFTLWHRIFAAIVFTISATVFMMTVAPTISFWDCSERITAAVTMGIPHPPGAPTLTLLGKIFSLFPVSTDLGFRVNILSALASSFSVLLVYLIVVRFLRQWKGDPVHPVPALSMLLSAAVSAFILSWSDTFWFNGTEAEAYGVGTFFIVFVMWIATEWYFKIGLFKTERTLLLIAYVMGLSIGVHLLSLLALFYVFVLIYFRDRRTADVTYRSVGIAIGIMAVAFFTIYPGIVKYIPATLGDSVGRYVLLLAVAALVYVVASKQLHPHVRMVSLAVLLVTLGYSTYSMIPIRSGQQPALNENAPATLKGLYSYLNRDQYGTYPLLSGPNFDDRTRSVNMRSRSFLPRRWNPESTQYYVNYSSDFDYFLKYQIGHIYLRYFLWNFVGRTGDLQDAPVAFIGSGGEWSERMGYPNRYYAIPLLLGLLGMYYHLRKDYRTGTAMLILFFMTGVGLVIYFNMAERQVRERDYFFVGSFAVFALWTGIGVYSIIEYIREKAKLNEAVGLAVAVLLFVAAPINMLAQNYRTHDRQYNYVAFDYAYNLLQSCDQDAIIFTGGDNDTFPLWYLQYAAGVRRDIRVINLSLLNTPWYSKQLKNERPYGAQLVGISYSDQELEAMRPVQWEARNISVPIDPEKIDLRSLDDVPFVRGIEEIPQTLTFMVPTTYTDPEGRQGIRNQDMLIIDILNQNINTRPIYFALSTAPGDRLGLDENLIVEGLAYRVTPFKFPQRQDRYYAAMNAGVLQRHLMDMREEPDSNRAMGFMFRELNNPRINLDEASTKMIYSFRVLYMALGQVLMQDHNDDAGARAALAKMEEVMPEEYHIFDPSLRTDLGNMYLMIRDTAAYLENAKSLEEFYLEQLERDPSGRSTSRSPYRFFMDYYEVSGQYLKAAEVLRKAQREYNDPALQQQIHMYERWAEEGKPTEDTIGLFP